MDELSILIAVPDAVPLPGPDGRLYPVLQPAPRSPLCDRIAGAARTTIIGQAIRLYQYAHRAAEPVRLFLSDEEGGYARNGFWLQAADGARRFCPDGYINMVVSDVHMERGIFDATFVHELAHLTLRALVGPCPHGPSRTPHHSMAVTDYPTALDEGWAEHMEAVLADHTANPWLLGRQRGAYADLIDTWVDEADGHLRQSGVRRNLFVHEKPLPEAALTGCPDPFQVWLHGQTMSCFLLERLKSGQARRWATHGSSSPRMRT